MEDQRSQTGRGSSESRDASTSSLSAFGEVNDEPNHLGADGTVDRVLKRWARGKFPGAIFIHAGAGFHSHQNEKVHLAACRDAVFMGMKFLKSGASATEAVEVALKVLEDKEITNAGYGSNLSIDGAVECDATIVDHFGRSGACGAVPNIRNPISLAKLILDRSSQPLSLRRVAPNILVGEGARAFAEEHSISTVANQYLVSKNARDRFLRWQDELRRAEEKLLQRASPFPNSAQATHGLQRDHASAILTGTWNEGQPDSPHRRSPAQDSSSLAHLAGNSNSTSTPRQGLDKTPLSYSQDPSSASNNKAAEQGKGSGTADTCFLAKEGSRDGTMSPNSPYGAKRTSTVAQLQARSPHGLRRPFRTSETEGEDVITDTVGAIAIDEKGNMAAGSSSGGIGMKHRGRAGPAALVGVGTALIPCDPEDPDNVTVAAVTSGTGEHMSTTMASMRCAERLYGNTRRGQGGRDIAEDDEDAIMESFINDDFMGHPGVKNSISLGAIGVMAVKKTRTGYYLYFAHNTDSFALASMGGADKEPVCVMSRLGKTSKVTRGARRIKVQQ